MHLGSVWMILLVWALGGVYTLLAANNAAELATMMPRARPLRVRATRLWRFRRLRRGWSDWMLNRLPLSFMPIGP